MLLADYLRYYREYYTLTQEDMAAELGISQPYLSEIECGKKNPKRLRARVLAKYPVTGDFLLYLKEIDAL